MKRNLFIVSLIAVISLFIFWLPFLFKLDSFGGVDFNKSGMETIVQNFDGLNFLIVAKSGYDPKIITQLNEQFMTGNTPGYFVAHFPLFPIMIRALSYVMTQPQALLAAIILSNIFLACSLYIFFSSVTSGRKLAILLTAITLFWPGRMLAVRGVGSNEPLFIALVVTSLAASLRNRDYLAGALGALAVLARSPGILLFGAYTLAYYNNPKRLIPYLALPLALLSLFVFYYFRTGSFFAYFESGDNLHLSLVPFQIFATGESWISGIWREDVLYLYLVYGLGLLMLNKVTKPIMYFGRIYGLVLLFVAHRDLARYALPLLPIAILGYAKYLSLIKKYSWLVLLFLVPIYLYAWQFVMGNIQPINDWGGLL